MTTARLFAALFVLAFFGAGYVPDGPLRTAVGVFLALGVVALCYGILHPRR